MLLELVTLLLFSIIYIILIHYCLFDINEYIEILKNTTVLEHIELLFEEYEVPSICFGVDTMFAFEHYSHCKYI
jgi:hypothetical protein